MQLADDASAIAGLTQAAGDVRSIIPVHSELPRRQSDLTILVRVKPGQQRGT